jgi:hypothetical protein
MSIQSGLSHGGVIIFIESMRFRTPLWLWAYKGKKIKVKEKRGDQAIVILNIIAKIDYRRLNQSSIYLPSVRPHRGVSIQLICQRMGPGRSDVIIILIAG